MLPLPTYEVLMLAPDEGPDATRTYIVQVRNSDRLLGEKKAIEVGVNARVMGLHGATLWMWAAMIREHGYSGKFQQFADDCLDFNQLDKHGRPVTPDTPDEDMPTVDPTQPATPAGLPSSSPATTEPSTAG